MRLGRCIPDNGTVFKVRADKGFVKINESGRKRIGVKVLKKYTYYLARFTTNRGNVRRPRHGG